MRAFLLAAVAATTLLASGSAVSEVVKIQVGPTLNPFFLRLTCNEIAEDRGGFVVKSERSGKDKTGVCFINVPPRNTVVKPTKQPGIVATPGGVVRQPLNPIQTPAAKLRMVGVGRLWSQNHANERCRALAVREDAIWTGVWKKHSIDEEGQCQLKTVPQPQFIIKEIDAGRIWSDAHARQKCLRIATENDGVWTGKWKKNPQSASKSFCMVSVKPEPKVVKRFKTTKIWSEAHAKQKCSKLAKKNEGEWLGAWRHASDGNSSICMIRVAASHQFADQTKPVQKPVTFTPSNTTNIRNVKAGAIWDQAHAERKCPVVARNEKGSWTKRWTKTGPGNESVCEVNFGGGIVAQSSTPAAPTASNTRTRNVAAGAIWDGKQAASKCPVVAANNKAQWTGNWTKTGPGHISVCEISVAVANTAQQQPTTSTLREVAAGGIWDQAHAERKCPVVAANNKARWTGNWRKVGANNASVCEIDTRL